MKSVLLRLANVLVAAALCSTARAETFAWVELGEGDRVIARTVVEHGRCPTLTANGAPLELKVRADVTTRIEEVSPHADFTKVTVCERDVPAGTTSLSLENTRLPLPRTEIRRIVVFGDTGCRIDKKEKGLELQDCEDEAAWPYAKLVRQAAAAMPDLVIHVGDYAYREIECPPTRNCGKVWGYGYDSWKADFFVPSRPLFQQAPWIMVRGNHEDCGRAGEGWLRFLDRDKVPDRCADITASFVVERSDMDFVVMDNAGAAVKKSVKDELERARAAAAIVATLQERFGKIVEIRQPAWILSHRPFNALRYEVRAGYQADDDIQYQTFRCGQGKGKSMLADQVQMVVSGHIHLFEALSFGDGCPPQLVVGTGADNLEDVPPQRSEGVKINNMRIEHGLVFGQFGYMVWDRDASGWRGTFFDVNGRALAGCTLLDRTLLCQGTKND